MKAMKAVTVFRPNHYTGLADSQRYDPTYNFILLGNLGHGIWGFSLSNSLIANSNDNHMYRT